jgi:hypothetical protein
MLFYDTGFLEQLFKPLGLQAQAEEFGYVLESALLVGGAVGAIYLMNTEQKAKGAFLQISYGRRVRFHNEGTSDFYGTGRDHLALYFNKTQSAGSLRVPHALEVAEVGDINPMVQAGFEQNGSLLDLHLFMVNHQFDHVLQTYESPKAGLCPLAFTLSEDR